MPTLDPTDVATALATRFAEVDGINTSLDYEPRVAKGMPMVSQLFQGFRRSPLGSPDIERTRDPIGGRVWVWLYRTRLWVPLAGDEAKAQALQQNLGKALVVSLEADPTLGIGAEDAAMSEGNNLLIPTKGGSPYLVLGITTAVQVVEARTTT